MKLICIVLLMLSQIGCVGYAQWRLLLAERDLVEERASITRLYRQCLETNAGPAGRTQCEHYTQALYSIDIATRK